MVGKGSCRPCPLRKVGTRRCSTTATSSASRPRPPHVGAGDEHRALGPGDEPGRGGDLVRVGSAAEGTAAGGIAASPSANTTSIGRSTNTGPRCGVSAVAVASWTTAGMSSTAATVRASLVTGASRGTWSSSCSEPEPQRACGARPPRTTTAEPLKCACVMADIPLVTPGPAEHGQPGPA